MLINLAMFPLRHKSVVSMRKMQELQPQMKAIQDRYAKLKMTDPARQKMNEEVMALYKRARRPTRPRLRADAADAAGAVRVLRHAVGRDRAARRAVHRAGSSDLSAHDPLFVTPVLMGLTQFIQTEDDADRPADPVQQKMMLFMPLMFTGMLLWAPSGLVLYWTVEQHLGDRAAGDHQPADRPAAAAQRAAAGRAADEERRRGTIGAGREGAEVMEQHAPGT